MERETIEKEIARRSAMIYIPLTLGVVILFLLATLAGSYPAVARIGGAIWIGLLTLIVSMPLVITSVKKRVMRRS